jgi:hypothetical protein
MRLKKELRTLGSVLIWNYLSFCIIVGWSVFYPCSRYVNPGDRRIYIPERIQPSSIKEVVVPNLSVEMNEQHSSFNLISDVNLLDGEVVRQRQKSRLLYSIGSWRKNRWNRDRTVVVSLVRFFRVSNLCPNFSFNNRSSCRSVAAYFVSNYTDGERIKRLSYGKIINFDLNPSAFFVNHDFYGFYSSGSSPFRRYCLAVHQANLRVEGLDAIRGRISSFSRFPSLPAYYEYSYSRNDELEPFGPFEGCIPMWRLAVAALGGCGGIGFCVYVKTREKFFCGMAVCIMSIFVGATGHKPCEGEQNNSYNEGHPTPSVHRNNVSQKLLTTPYFCNTLIAIGRPHMANVLSIDKQVAIISALAEGSGI